MLSVTDARRRLTEVVGRAERGERVILTRRGRPVAAIVAVDPEPEAEGPLGLAALAGTFARYDLGDAAAAVVDLRGASRDRAVPEIE